MPAGTSNILEINLGLIIAILLGTGITVVFFVSLYLFLITLFKNRKREERSIDSVLLEVAVSRSNEVRIDAMEQVFSSLFSIKKGGWKQKFDIQPAVSFEIVAREDDIRFFVWTPKKLTDLVEKQIHGAYPDAQIEEVEEYNIFTESGKVAYKSLQLRRESFYPIKTFKDLPTDPMSALTSNLAKMKSAEAAAIQILISPVESKWQKEGRDFISKTKKDESDPEKASFKVPAKTLEAVENKISKPGFEISIRIVVVSEDEPGAKAHMGNIMGAFEQFSGDLNGFSSRKIKRKGAFMEDFLYRYHAIFNIGKNKVSVVNSEELATIFHFPNKQITTHNIHWLNAKTAPAPAEIPSEGTFLGISSFRGVKKEVFISDEDRMKHLYIIGKTGTGKSELMKELAMQDIRKGRGVCVMDPHGDAVQDMLKLIPPERAEDVIYFNPSDTDRPMGMNLLEATGEQQQHFAATAVINMMYKLFDPYKTGIVGPRFEHGVRNAMLTVMQGMEGGTFVEVMRALTTPKFVQELLPKVQDQMVVSYWKDQIAQTADFHKSEVLDYTVSKFGRFVTNKMVRNIIGQSQSSFSFRDIMDNQKILLVNLSKGELGEENSNFLGLILVPRILMAAMSRQDTPIELRKPFYLYVDEFQNFATPDFAQILSEARKYALSLTVVNQFIGQVEEEVKNAIMGNAGTKICFRVGVNDANYLAREYAPVFGEEDLINVDRFNAYVKTIVNNEPVPPFSIDTKKDLSQVKAQENGRVAQIIIEMSRLKYGRDERLVEAEMARRAKL